MLAHQQCARMSACSTSYGAGSLQAGRARPAAAAALRWQAPGRRAQQQHSRRGVCQIVCVSDVGDDDFETEILQEYAGALKVVKVEADPNRKSIEKYGVYGLPCLILFKDGQEVEGSHHEGAVTKKALVEYLQKHLGLVPVSA